MSTPDTPELAPEASADTPTQADNAVGQDNQFVTFSIDGEMFAVPMGPVQEIIRMPEVARLPLAPPALDGLANLRGRVLPIVNLRRLFGMAPCAQDDATRALVINLGQPLGFVVDRVASVVRIEAHQIEPADAVRTVVRSDILTGVIKQPSGEGRTQLLLVLDFERLVSTEFAALHTRAKATQGTGRSGDPGGADTGTQTDADKALGDELRVVSFTVAAQEYGIDITSVQEIVQMPSSFTRVPNTESHVLGLMSLRQRLLPLVSLRSLFCLPAQSPDEQHRIVVVALPGGHAVGLVTDAVKEVLGVPRSETEAVPGVLTRDNQLQELESICRLEGGKRLVSIISASRLLGLQVIQEAVKAADHAQDTPHEDTTMSAQTDQRSSSPADDDTQVVIFRLGAEEFGVPIMSVQEIVRVPPTLTRVPKTPAFVEGVINLRGTVLPVIDQRARLGLDAVERSDRQRIMVYTLGGLRTGFIVDSVAEVLRIPRESIERAPAMSAEQQRLITRVAKLNGDKRLVMLIDPAQLLGQQETDALGALQPDARSTNPGGPASAASADAPWAQAA